MAKFQRYDLYKDSGVEWLGEIPEHWEILKLKFVAKQILGGGTPNSSNGFYWTDSQSDGYLWVSIEDISNSEIIQETKKYITKLGLQNCSAKIIKPYSILYSIYASLGKVAYSEKFLTTNQAILSIEIQKKHYYKFMFYYLKTLTQTAINLSNSTTQNNISLFILKNLYCVLPPKDEQEKIALYLDEKIAKIDTAISQKEKFIELLKEQKQIIINDAVTKGLNKNVKFKDSGVEWIGQIPKHWEILCGFGVFNENKRKNIGMLDNRVLSLSYGQIIRKPEEKLVGLVPESFETYQIVKNGDIIVRCTDLQNDKVSLRIGLSKYDGIITSAYLNLNVINGNPKYLYYFLYAFDVTKAIYQLGSGLRQGLSYKDFKKLNVLLPPQSEQEKIVEYIENKISKIDKLLNLEQEYIQRLKEYKSSLIDSVVTGKVKV